MATSSDLPSRRCQRVSFERGDVAGPGVVEQLLEDGVVREEEADMAPDDFFGAEAEHRFGAGFQLVMTPRCDMEKIPSAEDCTMAASWAWADCAAFRSDMSRMAATTSSPSSPPMGARLMSTGNSLPSLRLA